MGRERLLTKTVLILSADRNYRHGLAAAAIGFGLYSFFQSCNRKLSDHRINVSGDGHFPTIVLKLPVIHGETPEAFNFMDSQEISEDSKKGFPYFFSRVSFVLLYSIFAFFFLSFLVGIAAFVIGDFSISSPISVPSQCKIVSSSKFLSYQDDASFTYPFCFCRLIVLCLYFAN